MTDKYNGWTNYETWKVKLWIDNEQSSSEYWNESARDIFGESRGRHSLSNSDVARHDLADRLKDEVEESNPLADDASMYSDLLGAAISEVNWSEIANNLLIEVDGYEELV